MTKHMTMRWSKRVALFGIEKRVHLSQKV